MTPPFVLSSSSGGRHKVNWIRILETFIGAIIISFVVSYITVEKMQVELKHVWKAVERNTDTIEMLRNK